MAHEIHADYASANSLYAVVRNRQGQVWHPAGQAFENWGTGGHTADDYDLALTDVGGGRYVGNFDPMIPAGRYSVQVFRQLGANPADTDPLIASREIHWTGAGELTALTILANKAIHDALAGTIHYYDEDGQTVLFTHLTEDTGSTAIRTPQ